ncbi:MAG: nuclear transport factor 2 family protein [Bacteroidales bacterium]|jgi:ketosteroid isomerase-like protein
MRKTDPELIAKKFNDCINAGDLEGLTKLMTDDHTFIDRDGTRTKSKKKMTDSWKSFFEMFPKYKNTFTMIRSTGNLVTMTGYAIWTDERPCDNVIWTARISSDLVSEWRIYEDTDLNRQLLNLT